MDEHWVKYAMPFFLMVAAWVLFVFCISVGIAVASWNHHVSMVFIVVGHVLFLLFHHAAFYEFFGISTCRALITNRRIFKSKQRLWFSDETVDIPLWRVQSVEVEKRGILQHVLDYGHIVLNRGTLPSIDLVSHPDVVQTYITAQIQNMQPALEKHEIRTDNNVRTVPDHFRSSNANG